jgi:hypothetical protein
MGSVRTETYHCGEYLLQGLWQTDQIARVIHDGGDIILFQRPTGEKVSIHLIESGIELYEIRKTLYENAEKGIYTLFMLWGTMMVPPQGKYFRMDDWMEGFLALNNGSTYAYDILQGGYYLYPVYFRGTGDIRLTEYGRTITFRNLTCRIRETHLPGFADTWMVADFMGVDEKHEEPEAPPIFEEIEVTMLTKYYVILGAREGDDVDAIKQAYRTKARELHPDTNPAPDATEQMTQLNEAYAKILRALEAEA